MQQGYKWHSAMRLGIKSSRKIYVDSLFLSYKIKYPELPIIEPKCLENSSLKQ